MREVSIPAIGFAMTEALLVQWTRQPGDAISEGEVVAEIETDKTTAELEAPVSGILGRHRFAPGDVVPVGVALTVILAPGEIEADDAETLTGAARAHGVPATVGEVEQEVGVQTSTDRPPHRESPRQRAARSVSATPIDATVGSSADPGRSSPPIADREPPAGDQTTEIPEGPTTPVDLAGIDPDVALKWLRDMLLIREFEARCDPLSLAGKIAGGAHLSLGQEAIAVGVAEALRPGDPVAGTHRSHHHALAMGILPRTLMAELFGREPGSNGGRGGSMHVADLSLGFIGGNGIVGAGLGLALGAALSASVRRSGQVAVGFVGDGGVNTGRTWEFVNLAAVWKLPLVVVCENNLYAVETTTAKVTASASIVARAQGFGIRAVAVDGQDVVEVHRAVAAAAELARAGEGPTFVEARTYRYEGHSTGQAITYRTSDEVATWRATRDPISRLRQALAQLERLDDASYEALGRQVRVEIDDAVAFAEAAPWPTVADAARGVTALGVTVRRLG